MKQEKEFERNRCFMFFESYLESAEKYKILFGTEVAFNYLCGLARYALYQEESEDPITNGLVSALKNAIDSGQDKRAKGFHGENFEQTKVVAEYYRDHPNASQRAIADATNISKSKVQKTLIKIKESGMEIDDYIANVINPNLNNNLNNNLNSNLNNNGETETETSLSSTSENAKEETEKRETDREVDRETEKNKERTELKLLKDLTDEELDRVLDDYKRKIKYQVIQKKYKLANVLSNKLPLEIAEIKLKRKEEAEKNQSIIKKDKIRKELYENPIKKEKLLNFTECTSDEMLFECLEDIDRDIDDIINFYEDNVESKNEHNEYSFKRTTWENRLYNDFNTYETYIREVMDSNGYTKS